MKKLLVFLALFAAGVGILALLDRATKEPPPLELAPPPPRAMPPDEAPGGGAPVERAPERGLEPLGIRPGGAFVYRVFDEVGEGARPRRFELRAASTRVAARNQWEFSRVTATLYDPDREDTVQADLVAEKGLLTVESGATEYLPRVEGRFPLEGITLTLHTGAPVVPLEMRAANGWVDLDARRFAAVGVATIEGPGLSARGEDLTIDMATGTLAFTQAARVMLQHQDAEPASLTANGELRIQSDPGAGGPVTIEASEGAVLALHGEHPATLEGDRIRIRARDAEAAGGARLEALDAYGGGGRVRWTSGADVFAGDRARLDFDDRGGLAQARLSGLPTAVIELPAETRALADPRSPPATPERVSVAGAGPLTVTWVGGPHFAMEGPATVETAGAVLRSNGRVRGSRTDSGHARFGAWGGVVLESAELLLETAELEAVLEDRDGERVLRITTRGGAKATGTLARGRSFTLTTPEGLEIERQRERWRIVEANIVSLAIEGEDGFTATANRVEDLDLEVFSFVATGAIELENEYGRSGADRLWSEGLGNVRLEGSPARKANIATRYGRASALSIHVVDETLVATGDVEAVLSSESDAEGEHYDLSCDELRVERAESRDGGDVLRRFDLEARGSVRARLVRGSDTSTVSGDLLRAVREERFGDPTPDAEPDAATSKLHVFGGASATLALGDALLDVDSDELELTSVEEAGKEERARAEARGAVTFKGRQAIPFAGTGERLVLDGTGTGSLEPAEGGRVRTFGSLPSESIPFELTGRRIDFAKGRIEALDPEIDITFGNEATRQLVQARARALVATETFLELNSGVVVEGRTKGGIPWSLSTDNVRFETRPGLDPDSAELSLFRASGAVAFQLGAVVRAVGDELISVGTLFGTMRLSGSPARIESPLFVEENDWLEFDPELQIVTASGRGRMLEGIAPSTADDDDEDDDDDGGGTAQMERWSLEYFASRTLIEPDSLILVMQEPVFTYPGNKATLRASWAIFWLDRQRWEGLSKQVSGEEPSLEDLRVGAEDLDGRTRRAPTAQLFGLFETESVSKYLRECYFEGPVEVEQEGDLIARTDAIYLDISNGEGWLANATVNVWGRLIGQDFEKLVVKADWLRHSADNSLHADSATVTPCDFDHPHIQIVTGNLRIKPERYGGKLAYGVKLEDNRIELYDTIKLPLPPYSYTSDEKGRPFWETIQVGNSARVGNFVSAGIVRPAGKVGSGINKALKGDPDDFDANYSVRASYLGSRGGLLDLGLEIESKERYWLDMHVGVVPDSGRDRGYIRVDEDDRWPVRLWYRSHGRYDLGAHEWLDLSLSVQSDAGVQSEFWEDEFERYEEDENYARWRKAADEYFVEADVKARLNDFRSDVEELPAVSAYRSRAPLFRVGGMSLLHSGEIHADYVRRRAGEAGFQSPFATTPPLFDDRDEFADGFGDRETLRADTTQRVEAPFSLGVAGLRAAPFVEASATAWSEGQDTSDSPTRLIADAGVRLTTTFWKVLTGGSHHQVAPFVEYRNSFVEQRNEAPVTYDELEAPRGGDFVEAGVRGRFDVEDGESLLDVQIGSTYAVSAPPQVEEGWQPLQIFGRLNLDAFGRPLEVWHDARYDFDDSDTVYSLSAMALHVTPDLRFEAGHRRGLDVERDALFETASVAGLYTWTEKWEFEGRQTFSLLEDDELDSRLILRRFGHDVVFEVDFAFRAGEGTSFGVAVQPRLGYGRSRLGRVSY